MTELEEFIKQWDNATEEEKMPILAKTRTGLLRDFMNHKLPPTLSHLTQTDPIKYAVLQQLQASIHATTELVFAQTRALTDLYVECETIEDYVKITKQLRESLDD